MYIPKINQHLHEWKSIWNNHRLRIENDNSPLQLYTLGLQKILGSLRISQEVASDESGAVNLTISNQFNDAP